MICENIENRGGELFFAGRSVKKLAEKYGTPLYILDEARIRKNCRTYTEAFEKHFKKGSRVFYASKAASIRAIYRIIAEEGLGSDLVSGGEIYCAKSAGFDMSKTLFHGSSKTDYEIDFAMECGVGCFVLDGPEEAAAVNEAAGRRGIIQKVLIRVTPGIDTHTYEAINTGKVDSKFGAAIETGQAEALCDFVLGLKNLELMGFHCHVGSEVFEENVFERSAIIMLEFCADMARRLGYTARVLDLGGGYGVRYVDSDPVVDIGEKIASVAETVHAACEQLDFPEPLIYMEPGRSIVADAGLTAYTVGSVKRITGYKDYVSVDGGMTDNPRFALYRARYTCLPIERMDEPREMDCSVVGRCCESGDIIQEHVPMPLSIHRGDYLAVCTTGAYNYAMASNYNRVPKPAVVLLTEEGERLIIRRESYEDLSRCEEE